MYESDLRSLKAKKAKSFKMSHSLQVLKIQPFKNILEQEEENFIKQLYTCIERSVTDTGERRIQYLAGRLAAKKAIAIINTNNNRLFFWLDIEIFRLPTDQPSIVVFGQFQKIATRLGIKQWLLSISHTATYAVASAIAVV